MSAAGAAVRRALTDPSPQGSGAPPGGRADRARRRSVLRARRARGTLVLVAALAVAAAATALLLPDGSGGELPARQEAAPAPAPASDPPAQDPGPRRPSGTDPLLLVEDLGGAFSGARVLQELHAGPLVTLPDDEATAPDGSPLRGWCGDASVTGGEPPLTTWAGAWTDAPRGAAAPSVEGAPPRTGFAPGPGTVFEVVSRFPDAAGAEGAATTTVTSPTACRGRRAGEVWQVQGQPSVAQAVAVAPWRGRTTWRVRTTSVRGSLEVSLLCVVSAPDPAAAAEVVGPLVEAAVARAVALPDGA